MKKSQTWLNTSYNQNTFTRLSTLPIMFKSGPVSMEGPPKQKDEEGNEFFVAGESEVGGKEVVG